MTAWLIRQAAAARDRRCRAQSEIARCADHVGARLSQLQAPFWLGVVAPAGTPGAIIDKLNAALRESLAPRETRELLASLGAEIKIGTPAEFGKLLADELAQWTALVKAAHIRVE
jgi:Tripartite tricarboxylate transporter family receptor